MNEQQKRYWYDEAALISPSNCRIGPAQQEGLSVEKLREAKRALTATEIAIGGGMLDEWEKNFSTAVRRRYDELILAKLQLATSPPLIFKSGDISPIGIDFATKETPVTTKKQKPEKFNTIGVRYINAGALGTISTHKIRVGAKVHLGQELVIDQSEGPRVVVVVRIDSTPAEVTTYAGYITKKAVVL